MVLKKWLCLDSKEKSMGETESIACQVKEWEGTIERRFFICCCFVYSPGQDIISMKIDQRKILSICRE